MGLFTSCMFVAREHQERDERCTESILSVNSEPGVNNSSNFTLTKDKTADMSAFPIIRPED